MRNLILTAGLTLVFSLLIHTNELLAQMANLTDDPATASKTEISSNHLGTNGGGEVYEFTLTVDDPVFNNGAYERLRFFWYFGDGEYLDYTENFPPGGPFVTKVKHVYFKDVSRNDYPDNDLFVEVIGGKYDDKDPPKRAIYGLHGPSGSPLSIANNCNQCTPPQNNNFNSMAPLTISTNRNLVSDHYVTFNLSVVNNCIDSESLGGEVLFYFDSNELSLEQNVDQVIALEDASGISNSPFVPPGNSYHSGIDRLFKVNLSNLKQGEIRNIFIRMKVNNNQNPGDVIHTLAKISFDDPICPTPQNLIVVDTRVDNSHDPNLLRSTLSNACPGDHPVKIPYTVRFRNDGTAAAECVYVKMPIPDMFRMDNIEITYPKDNGNVPVPKIDGQRREVEWKLDGNWLKNNKGLKGTKQVGFGSQFLADATVDSIVFELTYLPTYEPQSCQTIINQAEIIFDANPSIFTGPYIYRFDCLLQTQINIQLNGVPDTIYSCRPCVENQDFSTAVEVYDPSVGPVELDGYDTRYIHFPNNVEYRWYPSSPLNDSTRSEPAARPRKSTEFFLTAYSSNKNRCARTIYRYPIDFACDLEIVPTITCNSQKQKQVSATVSGTYTSGALKWNYPEHLKCTGGYFSNSYTSLWLNQEELFLTVVDTVNNCYDTVLLDLSTCPRRRGFNSGLLIAAALTLLALLGLISRRRRP